MLIDRFYVTKHNGTTIDNVRTPQNATGDGVTKVFSLDQGVTKSNNVLVGYGAAAKGNTFLNFSKIKLNFIVDDNKIKQNKFCPGSKIPIKSINYLKNFNKNLIIIPLAWNFYKEIKKRVLKVRKNKKDKFVIFFPKFRIE